MAAPSHASNIVLIDISIYMYMFPPPPRILNYISNYIIYIYLLYKFDIIKQVILESEESITDWLDFEALPIAKVLYIFIYCYERDHNSIKAQVS